MVAVGDLPTSPFAEVVKDQYPTGIKWGVVASPGSAKKYIWDNMVEVASIFSLSHPNNVS